MTAIVTITAKSLPGDGSKCLHVEIFDHVDRQQIVNMDACFVLHLGESRDITLYNGRGFRVNEIDTAKPDEVIEEGEELEAADVADVSADIKVNTNYKEE